MIIIKVHKKFLTSSLFSIFTQFGNHKSESNSKKKSFLKKHAKYQLVLR